MVVVSLKMDSNVSSALPTSREAAAGRKLGLKRTVSASDIVEDSLGGIKDTEKQAQSRRRTTQGAKKWHGGEL